MLLRAESPWGLMTWKSQLNLTRAGLGERKWEKLDWGELKGNELWRLWFQITSITLLWNGDVTGEVWLGGQGSVCFKYGRYWSMFICWWSWFRREREIDAEERGENWMQILEQVEEIESGVQVGRAVPLEPECSYWDRGDSVWVRCRKAGTFCGRTRREFSSNCFLFSRK